MSWINTFNDVFFITIATLTFSFFGIVIKAMLASKCDRVNLCCSLIDIHRRVELESTEPTNQPNQNSP